MAGSRQRILPIRAFSFGTLAIGNSQTFTLAERVDISQYIDAMLAVRVHLASNTSGGNVQFDLYGDGFSDEDPGLVFRTAAPFFTSTALPSGFGFSQVVPYGGTVRGRYAALTMTVSRTSASVLAPAVSIDLILRTPDAL